MVKADLIIKCRYCGNEETIMQIIEDSIIDINLDKICPEYNPIKPSMSGLYLGPFGWLQRTNTFFWE
jgi:hypothetical protein